LQSLQLRLAAREHICRTLQEKVIMMAWAPFNVFYLFIITMKHVENLLELFFRFSFAFIVP
jgi:kinesin family protein C2/C3